MRTAAWAPARAGWRHWAFARRLRRRRWRRRRRRRAGPASMGQQVAGEVHAAALPCGAEDPGRGGLQTLVRRRSPASRHATRAGSSERRNSVIRRLSASDAPIAMPRNQPRERPSTATATVTATETMRPPRAPSAGHRLRQPQIGPVALQRLEEYLPSTLSTMPRGSPTPKSWPVRPAKPAPA